jgi:hypothetical protein
MADEADLAFDSEQRHLRHALAARQGRSSVLQPVGSCHNCGNTEGIAQRLFCDGDCAEDWEYEDTLRRRLGLPVTPTLSRSAVAEAAA